MTAETADQSPGPSAESAEPVAAVPAPSAEVSTPETQTPDTQTPETQTPKTTAADTQTPETTAPESPVASAAPQTGTLCLRFDIDKVEAATGSPEYGPGAWRILFDVVAPTRLEGVVLRDGCSAATLSRAENVFCVELHGAATVLDAARERLGGEPRFLAVAAVPPWTDPAGPVDDTLVDAGRVEGGQVLGGGWATQAVSLPAASLPAATQSAATQFASEATPAPAPTPPPTPAGPPPGWYADPAGRHQYRYWDGSTWTSFASDGGQNVTDPIG